VRSPEFFADAYLRTATVLELEHYGAVKKLGNWEGRSDSLVARYGKGKRGPDYLRGALELLHATYIGYHGYAHEWLADNPKLTGELVNRCGYWLFPSRLSLPEKLVPGRELPVRLTLENRGVAPPYHAYRFRVKLANASRTLVSDIQADPKAWLPGEPSVIVHELITPPDLAEDLYTLSIGLFDDSTAGTKRPVEFALKASLRDSEGFYRLITIKTEIR
jgi:hypothetical protein